MRAHTEQCPWGSPKLEFALHPGSAADFCGCVLGVSVKNKGLLSAALCSSPGKSGPLTVSCLIKVWCSEWQA